MKELHKAKVKIPARVSNTRFYNALNSLNNEPATTLEFSHKQFGAITCINMTEDNLIYARDNFLEDNLVDVILIQDTVLICIIVDSRIPKKYLFQRVYYNPLEENVKYLELLSKVYKFDLVKLKLKKSKKDKLND